MTYRETRLAGAAPFFLITVALALLLCVLANGSFSLPFHVGAWTCFAASFILAALHLAFPKFVAEVTSDQISIRGLRPGAWKFFQLWRQVVIPRARLAKIEIGNIGEGVRLGRTHLLTLDASKNAISQNVCVIYYRDQDRNSCIYYPHLNVVANHEAMVKELRTFYGDFLDHFGNGQP